MLTGCGTSGKGISEDWKVKIKNRITICRLLQSTVLTLADSLIARERGRDWGVCTS